MTPERQRAQRVAAAHRVLPGVCRARGMLARSGRPFTAMTLSQVLGRLEEA